MENLFRAADVQIDGAHPWDLQVSEKNFSLSALVAFHLEGWRVDPKLNHAGVRRRKFSLTMRVLAIDASLRNTGVAVIDANGGGKFQALYFGVIHNSASLPMSSCLVAIRDRLAELIQRTSRIAARLSRSFTCKATRPRSRSARRAGRPSWRRRSAACRSSRYAPKRIKQATVGNGSADKSQVAFMVRALLGLIETPGADAADALAIGLTHLRAQEAARLGLPGGARI